MVRLEWRRDEAVHLWQQVREAEEAVALQAIASHQPQRGELMSVWRGLYDLERRLLVAVNYGPTRGQCYVRLPWPDPRGKRFVLRDLLGADRYARDGADLAERGLYLDLPEWGHHAFEVLLTAESANGA